jgi:hypothetical protein
MMEKVIRFFVWSLLLVSQCSEKSACQWVIHHDPVFMPGFPRPQVGDPYTDPKFGTTVVRLTDAVTSSFSGSFPDYSKRQAWNADGSKMLLRTDDGYTLLLDGNTYTYIQTLDVVGGQDLFWHPANPDILYYAPDSILYSFSISSGQPTKLHDFAPYTWANTAGEGNLSDDGRYYAVVGQYYNYSTGEVTFSDILVYDLVDDQIISNLSIPPDSIWGFDWVSISRGGDFVVVDYADTETGRFHGVEVYDRMMNFVWQKPLGAGHSDLGIDNAGDDVLVMDIYDEVNNETVFMKYRLSDGQETELLRVSPLFDQHISCRNEKRREYCFISTFDYIDRLIDDSLSWLPFEDEVFALKLDGSGEVERIAHHHSRRYSPLTPDPDNSVYWAEPHATADRDGRRVLFGSNWRESMQNVSSVDAWVVDFSSFIGFTNDHAAPREKCCLHPNPAWDHCFLYLGSFLSGFPGGIVRMYDAFGHVVKERRILQGNNPERIDLQGCPNGIYLVVLFSDGGIAWQGKLVVLD